MARSEHDRLTEGAGSSSSRDHRCGTASSATAEEEEEVLMEPLHDERWSLALAPRELICGAEQMALRILAKQRATATAAEQAAKRPRPDTWTYRATSSQSKGEPRAPTMQLWIWCLVSWQEAPAPAPAKPPQTMPHEEFFHTGDVLRQTCSRQFLHHARTCDSSEGSSSKRRVPSGKHCNRLCSECTQTRLPAELSFSGQTVMLPSGLRERSVESSVRLSYSVVHCCSPAFGALWRLDKEMPLRLDDICTETLATIQMLHITCSGLLAHGPRTSSWSEGLASICWALNVDQACGGSVYLGWSRDNLCTCKAKAGGGFWALPSGADKIPSGVLECRLPLLSSGSVFCACARGSGEWICCPWEPVRVDISLQGERSMLRMPWLPVPLRCQSDDPKCSGRHASPKSSIYLPLLVVQEPAEGLEGNALLSGVSRSGHAHHTDASFVTCCPTGKDALCNHWQVRSAGLILPSAAERSGPAGGPRITGITCAPAGLGSILPAGRLRFRSSSLARAFGYLCLVEGQWSLELFALGAQLVEVAANRSLCLVRLSVAPASVLCHRPVDWSLQQWSHYACPCSASAHKLGGIHSTQLNWSLPRHVHDTALCTNSANRFLHAVAMPLPGTPIGGERPARVAANDTASADQPAGLPAEDAARELSMDIFADPVVALPEQLHPPRRRLGCYAVRALQHTIRLDVTEARPTMTKQKVPGPSSLKVPQASPAKQRCMAVAKVLAKSGLRCLICHRLEGSCVHTRLTRPDPVCEKVDAPTESSRCQTHRIGTAKGDLLSSPLVYTCMRCHKVPSLGPTGPFCAELRRPGQSCAGATLGSPGTERGRAEGFASPLWKPHGTNGQGGRGPLELVGEHVHFCSPACCSDGSAMQRVTIRHQAICAEQWLGVGTSNAQSQVQFFSWGHRMLWVRMGALRPGRHTFRLVQQELYWPVAQGVPDRGQQIVHSAQAAASFSSLGAAGELSRSELRCLCNCKSSPRQKHRPTCRLRSSHCSVQDSAARVVLVTSSPVLLGRGFAIADQTCAPPLGRMDLIEQYQSEADEPATPPTPTRPSSMATMHDPEWTLQTDEGALCRALRAAGADFADLEALGRRLLEEACVDEADTEHLRWRLGIIGDRPSPLEIVLHFAIFLDGPQLQVWYLRLLDNLQSAAAKRDFPGPCWEIIVPANFCRTVLLRLHVNETEPQGHVRHRTGQHVPGTRSLKRCFRIPVDSTRSDQKEATRMLELGGCLDPSLCSHLGHRCSPLDGVECLLPCHGPWQRRDGARLPLRLPTGGLSLAADSKGGLNCLRHAPILHWPAIISLNTLVNASAFPVGLVCSSPSARGRIRVERRGYGHMSDAAGHSFCRTLLSERGSRMSTADATTGGSCAGAWPPGALYLVTFHRGQCLKVPQVPGLKHDLPTKPKRPVCRVGRQQCQHPAWSWLLQAVSCGGRLCTGCVTRVAPTETAQPCTTHGTIDHSSTSGRCGKATPGNWTKSANKETAKLQAGGTCHSCSGDSRCIAHHPSRMHRLDFREHIMWTARCLWRPALPTPAFSRGYPWVCDFSIARRNPGHPGSAEMDHLRSGTAACQSSAQAGSTAVDWFLIHQRGRKMHTHHNEVAGGFSSSGTCSRTSSGQESGAWGACRNTSKSFVQMRCHHAITGIEDPIVLLTTAQPGSRAGSQSQVGGMPPKPFKSKCTMARQGQRLGKRQRDEAREQRAMSQHDRPSLPTDAHVQTASLQVHGTGTARPLTRGPAPLVPPGEPAELAPSQPESMAYCQGHKWEEPTQAMSSPYAGPEPLAQGSALAVPMGSPTVAALGLPPVALTLTRIQRPSDETPIGSAWMEPVSAAASSSDHTRTPEADRVVRVSGRPAQACKDEATSDCSSSSSELVPDPVQTATRVPPPPPPPRRKRASRSLSESVAHRAKRPSVSMSGASSFSSSMGDLVVRVTAGVAESDGSDGTTSTELRVATDSSSSEEASPSTDQPQENLAELRSKLMAVFARNRDRTKLALLNTARICSEWMWHSSNCLMPCGASACPGSQVVCVTTPAAAGRACLKGFIDAGAAPPHRERTANRTLGINVDIDLSRPAYSQRLLRTRVVLSGACSSPLNRFPQCRWRKRQAVTLHFTHLSNSWDCARLRQKKNPAVCERWPTAGQTGAKGHAVVETWRSQCRCGEHGLGNANQWRGLMHGQWENLVRATCIPICLSLLVCLGSIWSFLDCRFCRPAHWRMERVIPQAYRRRRRAHSQLFHKAAGLRVGYNTTTQVPECRPLSRRDGITQHTSVPLRKTHQSRAAWGPKSPGWLLLGTLIIQIVAVGAAPQKPRVVEGSTTSAGAIIQNSRASANAAKHSGKHLATAMARKRAYKRACNRVAKAGPEGRTWYRGRLHSAQQLGLEHRPSRQGPNPNMEHQARRRNDHPQLSPWPPLLGSTPQPRTSRQLSILSINLGGLTAEGYEEFCQWLDQPETVRNLDVICVQETWRLSSDYLLPNWAWVSSGSKPLSGQGVAVLVNKTYADPALIRTKEVRVGRILQVQIPAKADRQGRVLNVVSVYMPSKVSESRYVYEKREACWQALNQLLHSVPSRHFLCVAGDFNTDLQAESPIVGTTFRHKGVAQDQGKFQALLRTHRMHALNTWTREATYVEPGGNASRVDFVLVRARQAKGHHCRVLPQLHFASWRQGARHLAVAAYVDMQGWTAQSSHSAPQVRLDREALARACIPGPEQAVLLHAYTQVQHRFTPDLSPDEAEAELIHLSRSAFPALEAEPHLRPWQLQSSKSDVGKVWELRKAVRETVSLSLIVDNLTGLIFRRWTAVHKYMKQVKLLKANSRRRRKEHWIKQLEEAEKAEATQNPLKFFQVINRLAPRRSMERVQIRDGNGGLLGPHEEARALASYWQGIYKAEVPYERDWQIQNPLAFTWNEIRDALLQLKQRKANAPHTAPAGAWKALAPQLATYLEAYLQNLWKPGDLHIPEVWTTSFLHFLVKPNKPARRAQDMRPIALQSPAAKAITSILRDRIRPYVNEEIRYVPQFAYVTQRSTLEAIARVARHCATIRQLVKEQSRNLEARFNGVTRSSCTGGAQLAIDLTKAFDLLPRHILHTMLVEAGVPAAETALVMLWHQNGVYKISEKGSRETQDVSVEKGVRQGCVLSPLLWSLFTCHLAKQFNLLNGAEWTQEHATFYADDMHFCWTVHDVRDLRKMMIDVNNVYTVLENMGMNANAGKSTFLYEVRGYRAKQWCKKFIRKNKQGSVHFHFGGRAHQCIPVEESFQYLGVILSYRGFENATVRHRLNVASGHFERLRRILHARKILSSRTRHRLWCVMVQTAQLYAIEAVGVTVEGVRMIHVQTLRHLRGIYRSARHVDGLSDHDFLSKFGITDPRDDILKRCRTITARLGNPDQLLPCFGAADLLAWTRSIMEALPEAHQARSRPSRQADSCTHTGKGQTVSDPWAGLFKCQVCGMRFTTLHELKSHEGKAHGVKAEKQVVQKHEHGMNGKPTCRHCGADFGEWKSLARHIARQGCPALKLGQVDAALKASGQPEVLPPVTRPDVASRIAEGGWPSLTADSDLCQELKQRCCICYQWVSAANGLKAHIRKSHKPIMVACEPHILAQQKIIKPSARSPCAICGAVTADPRQHAGNCNVLFQILLLSQHLTGSCAAGAGSSAAARNLWGPAAKLLQFKRPSGGGRPVGDGSRCGAEEEEAGRRARTASIQADGRGDGEQRLGQDQKLSSRRQGQGQGQREERSDGGRGCTRGDQTSGLHHTTTGGSPCASPDGHRLRFDYEKRSAAGVHVAHPHQGLDTMAHDLERAASGGQQASPDDLDYAPLDGAWLKSAAGTGKTGNHRQDDGDRMDGEGRVALSAMEPGKGRAGERRFAQATLAGFFHRAGPTGLKVGGRTDEPDALPGIASAHSGHERAHRDVPAGHRTSLSVGRASSTSERVGRSGGLATGCGQTSTATSQARPGGGALVQVAGGTLRLRNPNNQCYINSVIIACVQWLMEGHRWQGDSALGRALQQLMGLPRTSLHHVLSLIPFRPLFDGWVRPSLQHDASEFLLHLLNARDSANELSRWRSYAQTPAGAELESYGHAVVPLHLPQVQDGVTLEECIQAWHTQESARHPGVANLHHILDGETHVAFVLQRFRASADGIRKILTPVQVPSQCALPLFRQGRTHWSEFHVDAIVTHIGNTPTTGHYRSFFRTLSGAEGFSEDGVRARRPSRADKQLISTGGYIILMSMPGTS